MLDLEIDYPKYFQINNNIYIINSIEKIKFHNTMTHSINYTVANVKKPSKMTYIRRLNDNQVKSMSSNPIKFLGNYMTKYH